MRADGKRVSGATPMYTMASYFMVKRYDAQNMIEVDIPLGPISDYIHEKRREGKEVTHLGTIIAAYLRTVAEYPLLNRFIANKKAYARKEMTVGMVVLKPGDVDGTMNKVRFELEDDVFTVQNKLNAYVEENRAAGDTNSTDRVISFFLAIPGVAAIGTGLMRLLDHFGLLPKALIDASPFHTSMVISNLASIQTNHIYHHVYQFGTTGILITIGVPKEIPHRHGKDGITFERCLPLGVVMDERICSGCYYATAFSRMKEYLRDPHLLEGAPAFPVVREWAKPGDYEKLYAKQVFGEEKKRIKKSALSKKEKRAAIREAKRRRKTAIRAAQQIRKQAKKDKRKKKRTGEKA